MKKPYLTIIIVVTALLFHNRAHAQFSNVMVSFSGKAAYTRGASFGRMADSYNAQNPDNEKKLKNFGLSTGWNLNVDWTSSNIYMGYYQHKVYAKTSSKINDYLTREFSVEQKAWGMDFGAGNIEEEGGLIFFGGIYFSAANLSAALKYRDGYRSLGGESAFNGVYHGFGVTTGAGIKGFVFDGPIGFTYALRWCHIFSNIGMNDAEKGFGTESLSENWQYEGPDVTPKFNTFSIELGIACQLILSK